MTSHRPSDLSPRFAGIAAAFAIVAAVAFVYWPGVHGFWGRDDYFQLALARMVGSPWPLFVHDHFPVPGSVFRPLGFASFWLGAALFGTDYAAHALGDLALHVGVALALFGLLRRIAIPTLLAFACALLFALHPAVLGSALWWSARFDLLASLFVLLALNAALAYRENGRGLALASVLVASMAAMLSKEIGLVALVPISLLWLQQALREPTRRPRMLRSVVWLWACAVIYFGWRWAVLGTPTSGLTGEMPLARAIAKGVSDWLRQMPAYLSFWSRLDHAACVVIVAALALLAAMLVAGARRRAARIGMRGFGAGLLCGACLFLLPPLLQAPVAALNAAPISNGVSAIEAAMQSRLYYLGIAGLAIALAAVLAPLWSASSPRRRGAILVPLAAVVLMYASASHEAAYAFAQRSVAISAVAREAVAAVTHLQLPAAPCHVVFLDVEPAPEWDVFVSMDAIVKALAPDPRRLGRCMFHANYPTWFHLLDGSPNAAEIAPYQMLRSGGHVLPWLRFGDLTIAYMKAPEQIGPDELARMRFLRWRGGHFEDVTSDVVAGRVPVRLQ